MGWHYLTCTTLHYLSPPLTTFHCTTSHYLQVDGSMKWAAELNEPYKVRLGLARLEMLRWPFGPSHPGTPTPSPCRTRCASVWPAWICVWHAEGPSHPGTPIPSLYAPQGVPVGPPGNTVARPAGPHIQAHQPPFTGVQVRLCPAWKCCRSPCRPSHPGTPTPLPRAAPDARPPLQVRRPYIAPI